MTMVVHVPRRHQRCDVTAVQDVLARQAQLGPAALMANYIPMLMSLRQLDRGDPDPAPVGMGVGHYAFGPVDEYQARTPFWPGEPVHVHRRGRHSGDQRSEELVVGGQFRQ
jgi:hypothetical protein